ncbi:MAG: FAD-dependent oxidoreductase [Candidatus Omnitrophica bacterium]|nr:FAD-dependent oxidoreductase [Candidatus Omnitrophota bacterium]
MRVAVIGAGPAGITAAYELARQGIAVDVFELSAVPGGMAKTIQLWDQKVDLGGHRFFSKDSRVNRLWFGIVGSDHKIINRLSRIFYDKKFYFYPLSPLDVVKNLSFPELLRCGVSYSREKIFPTVQDGSFENWVVSRFGRRLFDIFFKSYSEKLWGVSCKEIDSDFAAQRIKKLSLLEAVKKSFFTGGAQEHQTLLDKFAYPNDGAGIVYQRMADFVVLRGGKIYYTSPVRRVLIEQGRVSALEFHGVDGQGKILPYDHIVSSMPITQLVLSLSQTTEKVRSAAQQLTFRNTILVYLHIDAKDICKDQWIYIQSKELKTGRVTNFRNWAPLTGRQEDGSIIVLEYWCNDADAIWSDADTALMALARDEFKQLGFPSAKILNGHVVRLPQAYPVYRKGYKEPLTIVVDHLKSIAGLSVIGRYGAFKYNNQDHSILMGILVAENIVQGSGHDLWAINTDYEDYQESMGIAKKGVGVDPMDQSILHGFE